MRSHEALTAKLLRRSLSGLAEIDDGSVKNVITPNS
jgi:hypothetical protein